MEKGTVLLFFFSLSFILVVCFFFDHVFQSYCDDRLCKCNEWRKLLERKCHIPRLFDTAVKNLGEICYFCWNRRNKNRSRLKLVLKNGTISIFDTHIHVQKFKLWKIVNLYVRKKNCFVLTLFVLLIVFPSVW